MDFYFDRINGMGERINEVTTRVGESSIDLSRVVEVLNSLPDTRASINEFYDSEELYRKRHGSNLSFVKSYKEGVDGTLDSKLAEAVMSLLDICTIYRVDLDWHMAALLKYKKVNV